MARLGDRLDFIVGAKAAGALEETFGIRTVDVLLRHYPRKYIGGMTVRDEGEDLDLEEGQHVTFVDTITGHSLKDVEAILDAHYLSRTDTMADNAIQKLEQFTVRP